MKKLYSDVPALTCIALSLVCGVYFASPDNVEPANELTAGSQLQTRSETVGADGAAQFVQEPGRRSSFRKSYSSFLRGNERSNRNMLQAFSEAVAESRRSTVRFLKSGRQIGLGAVVGSEGWVATKASLLGDDDNVQCALANGARYDAKLYAKNDSVDLAIVHIDAERLKVVQWDSQIPSRGRWLATTDLAGLPVAVGVASTGLQRIKSAAAVLGVYLDESPMGGAVVSKVLRGSGAEQAGLRRDDRIVRVNGMKVRNKTDFQNKIRGGLGGDALDLAVERGGKHYAVTARLMDLSDELLDETEMEVSGPISHRATGFEQVLIHDTVLEPNQCGGPLVNVDGRVVGLNIARAGRVTSYALPTTVVRPAIDELLEEARLVSRSTESSAIAEPVR